MDNRMSLDVIRRYWLELVGLAAFCIGAIILSAMFVLDLFRFAMTQPSVMNTITAARTLMILGFFLLIPLLAKHERKSTV